MDEHSGTVGIIVFGLNRRLSVSYQSIYRNLLIPLSEAGFQYSIFTVLSVPDKISNPRSQETNAYAEFSSAKQLDSCELRFLSQRWIDSMIENMFLLARGFGDPWDDSFVSLHNHIRYLYVLREATTLALHALPNVRWFLFLRPDLIFSELIPVSILINSISQLSPNIVLTPNWDRWGGANDRYCLASRGGAKDYGLRYSRIEDYLYSTGHALHSETFLQWVLDNSHDLVHSSSLPYKAHRIRSKGGTLLIDPEDLSVSSLLEAQRSLLRAACFKLKRTPLKVFCRKLALCTKTHERVAYLLKGCLR